MATGLGDGRQTRYAGVVSDDIGGAWHFTLSAKSYEGIFPARTERSAFSYIRPATAGSTVSDE